MYAQFRANENVIFDNFATEKPGKQFEVDEFFFGVGTNLIDCDAKCHEWLLGYFEFHRNEMRNEHVK